jgi:tetratricopeptide (TPR) repeat protein
MKSDAIAFGIAGILFGLIAGWIIGSQQAAPRSGAPPQVATAAPTSNTNPPPAVLDETKVNAFKTIAERDPKNVEARVQLGNLYFDAERYQDAIQWYGDALMLAPNDVNVSTDLGVSYYYTNDPDRALAQFTQSLKMDPKHTKTLLNVGIVKAFGKQDLDGALVAWQQVLEISPDSPEGQAARRALDSMRSAHPAPGTGQKPGD